jgi:hypothetical protein
MAFSDFSIEDLEARLGVQTTEVAQLFPGVGPMKLPESLALILSRFLPVALSLNTEKARSEFLIAPVLMELKLAYADRLSLFSGIDLSVDPSQGLSGRCDFILARSPRQIALTAPLCVLVEAKNEDLIAGIPQCLAEMVAAQRFNQNQNQSFDSSIYGAVTTGIQWRFLQLDRTLAKVDRVEYGIQQPDHLFGVLSHIALSP